MCCTGNSLHSLICVAVASFAVLAQPAVAQGSNTTLPLTYPRQILQGDGSRTCPSEEQERVRNEVDSEILRLVQESVVPLLQATQTQLPTQPTTQSPTTQPTTQSPTTQPSTQPTTDYSCGGSTGWRRVAYLNMSDPSQQCPSAWRETTTPHRVCGRRSTAPSCDGVTYPTGSEQYNQVCGRIIGYQVGIPEAFIGSGLTVYAIYVDGISVTHGQSPRQHIWTFATGIDELNTRSSSSCPCVNESTSRNNIPSFVGQNYFCETGLTRWNGTNSGIFWPDGDPLWDGQGCGPTSSCCTFNSPPWFNVTLPSPTTNNIEVRICDRGSTRFSDSPIQLVELYVK